MYKIIKTLVLALLITVLALPAALAAEKNPNGTEVQVSGNYQEEIAPDTAYINLGTVTEAETLGEAQAKNADISAKLRNKLEIAGIKSEYIKTANYDVTPLYKNDDNGRRLPSIKGYQVTNSIIVTTVPDKAGEVIDTALNAGANQVNSVRFGKNTEGDIKNAALAQAVRDALRKADVIAATLNKQVVRVKTVNESGVHLQSPELGNRYFAKLSAGDSSQPTPISAGLITLTANVQVIVELE